jgi:hypothetical protein
MAALCTAASAKSLAFQVGVMLERAKTSPHLPRLTFD